MGSRLSCLSMGIIPFQPLNYEIHEIKSQRDDLLQYREELERRMELCKSRYTEFCNNNEIKRAKYAYCIEKVNEKLLTLIDSTILQILNLLSDVHYNRSDQNVFSTLLNGIDTINKINYSILCQWEFDDEYQITTKLTSKMPELFGNLLDPEDTIEDATSPPNLSNINWTKDIRNMSDDMIIKSRFSH